MSALLVLIPISLVLAAAALGAFIWSVTTGQLDDLSAPGGQLLIDDSDEGGQ